MKAFVDKSFLCFEIGILLEENHCNWIT